MKKKHVGTKSSLKKWQLNKLGQNPWKAKELHLSGWFVEDMYPFKMRGTNKLTILFLCLTVWGMRLWKASLSFSHIIPHWHNVCLAQQIEPRTRHNCWVLLSQNHPKSYLWTCMYTAGSWQGSSLVTAGHVDLSRVHNIWIFALPWEWNLIIPALNWNRRKIFEVPLYVSIHLLLLGLSNEVIFYRRNWELGEAVFLQPWWGSSLEDWDIFAASQHRSCTCSKFGWGAGKPAQLHLVFICLCVAIWPVLTETRWHLSKAKHSNLSRAMCNERQGGFVLVGKACHMFERPEKAISMETC